MTIPKVLGIGYPKAATTYISAALACHPEVCFSSRKETHFFEQNEPREIPRAEVERLYGEFFTDFDAAQHRLAMEWTVTYITEEIVLDRLRNFFTDDTVFLLASRDPVRSVLSSYFYHRTISNDLHASRLSQAECLDRHPEVYITPYLLGTHYRRFRERFAHSKIIIVPQAAIKRSSEAVFSSLFSTLGLSEFDGWKSLSSRNVPYPYRSWRADKVIRWTLVRLYGNRRTKLLYSSPNSSKPAFMNFLHNLNRGHYGFEPNIEDRISELLLPDFKDFVNAVIEDENTVVLGTREDLSEGLV